MSKVEKHLEALLNANPLENMAPALVEALKEHRSSQSNKAKALLVSILATCDAALHEKVASVRAQKRALEIARKQLEKVDSAVEKFKATGNPMPFFKAIGDMNGACRFCREVGLPLPQGLSFEDEMFNG